MQMNARCHFDVVASHSPDCADLPPRLQPDMMLVIPKLLRSAEQNAAAVKLLGALAEAQQDSPQADSHLRASALGALSMLRMEPATADRSLRAALQV